MIHIVTVHHGTNEWVPIQLRYFEKFIPDSFQLTLLLSDCAFSKESDVDASRIHKLLHTTGLSHSENLNACISSLSGYKADDLLIVIDGDAFPVAPIVSLMRKKIEAHSLVAAQRTVETHGRDSRAHPCFIMTSMGFFNSLNTTFDKNPSPEGIPPDVGGALNCRLIDLSTNWFPLTRSNIYNPHFIMFGLYGDMIYHHGAGFRPKTFYKYRNLSAIDRKKKELNAERASREMIKFINNDFVFYTKFMGGPKHEIMFRLESILSGE